VPAIEDSEDSEEERPRKKEAWRKRFHLPDYRKVKIGEYYDEDLDVSCSGEGESDSARSSFESDKSVEAKTVTQQPQIVCSGCNYNFMPPSTSTITPAVEKSSSLVELGRSQQEARSRRLRVQTPAHTRYRCLWPGCKIVLCSKCSTLIMKPKNLGGMGGSLPALQLYWEQQKNAEVTKSTTSEVSPKSDGAMTADIVQAVTSTPTSSIATTRQINDISETINVVDHTVAMVEGKIGEKSITGSVSTASHKENNTNGLHSIVVTVKELGPVAQEVKAL